MLKVTLIGFRPILLFAGMALGVLGTAPAGAASLLSETVYVCDESSGCALFSSPPLELPGPNPVDPSATASDTDTVPLTPSASVGGVAHTSGLTAQASAQSPPAGSPPSPHTFRLAVSDSDLSVDGRLVASLYWEDEITINIIGGGGGGVVFKPVIRFSGDLDLFTDPDAGGVGNVEWLFAMSINNDTFWTEGGSCRDSSGIGNVACAPSAGFGTFSPFRDVFIQDGVQFNLKAGFLATLGGAGITGSADLLSTIEWLGIELFDASTGEPIHDFTVTSASGIDWSLASVPEPPAVPALQQTGRFGLASVLLALGLVGIAAMRRRTAA